MKNLAFDTWDHGRLTINSDFADLFSRHQLTSCDAIWNFSLQAETAKALRTDRVTLRFTLQENDETPRVFYIKRHGRSSWKEFIKPWLHGQKPLLGAQHEWDALLAFHRRGLPTMTPVAVGFLGVNSFLITESLEGCEKLSAVIPNGTISETERREVIDQVAAIAREMHASGLHHQDFYLGHLLRKRSPSSTRGNLYVIDLGRVQPHGPWFARRWIVKDLAQLNYSARKVRKTERLRFLVRYLQRMIADEDRGLIRSILRKTARIGRHSQKNTL